MRSQLGILNAVLTIGVVAVLIVWGVTALTNEDPLWFVHRFDARANELVIYWDGATYTLQPGDPGYDAVMDAFATAIAHPAGFDWGVAFSETNIATYQDRFQLLEVHFAQPIQVHTRHPFNAAATYLVPLNKTQAYGRHVFSFPGKVPYTSGPLTMSESSFSALYNAVATAVDGMS